MSLVMWNCAFGLYTGILKDLDISRASFSFSAKGDIIYYFLFALAHITPLLKKGSGGDSENRTLTEQSRRLLTF